MKKIVSLICLISAILVSTPCYASYDIEKMIGSGMSLIDIADMMEADHAVTEMFSLLGTNELAILAILCTREVQRRSPISKEVVVPMGEYIVGEDIPAGVYTVTTGDSYSNLQVYSNGKRIYVYDSLTTETIGKLTLTTGQIVKVQYDSMTFAPYKGLGF